MKAKVVFRFLCTSFLYLCTTTSAMSALELHHLAPDVFTTPKTIGPITPLTGGLTNDAFVVDWHQHPVVVRLGTSKVDALGIQRSQELFFHQMASFLNIAPQILYADANTGLLISQFIQGETLNSKTIRHHMHLEKLIDLIHQYQHIKKPMTSSYSRIAYAQQLFTSLQKAQNQSHATDASYQNGLDWLAKLETKVPKDDYLVMAHHDLFSSNIMFDGKRLWLIDWEYARFADRYIDLCCLIAEDGLTLQEMKMLFDTYHKQASTQDWQRFIYTAAVVELQSSLWYTVQLDNESFSDAHLFKQKTKHHLQRFHQLQIEFNKLSA